LKNLDPDAEGEYLHNVPDIVHDLIGDLGRWTSDEITDKKFCGRLFIHCHNLMHLFDLFSKEKEVAEFIKDQTAYDEEYAKRNPEPEDYEIPF
ncbi:unnamed protein product, partial [marine sediment metagenome]